MRPEDLTKYLELLARAYALQDRLRKDPPSSVAEYTALVQEIAALWTEIEALISASDMTPGDIEAAHRANQTIWSDPKPEETAEDAFYKNTHDLPVWSDADLLAYGYKAGEEVVESRMEPKFGVRRRGQLDHVGFKHVRYIRG